MSRYHEPQEFIDGVWRIAHDGDADAVITYATEPSPETGHVGWCWWARGRMGDASSAADARRQAEAALAKMRTEG